MSLQVNQSAINALSMQTQKKVDTAKQEQQEAKPQIKEHCSSKAGKALRGMALGLMMAAGVASLGKAVTVQAAENQTVNNQTAVTQESEENVAKTDVEMAVDEMMEEESKTSTIKVTVDKKYNCSGEMTKEGRNYEKYAISSEGVLSFYREVDNSGMKYNMGINADGSYGYGFHFDIDFEDKEQNSFNLGSSVKEGEMELQVGERIKGTSEKNGDYVQLSEDGKTMLVYDEEGKTLGSITFETSTEEVENNSIENKSSSETSETARKAVCVTMLGAGAMGVGIGLGIAKKEEADANAVAQSRGNSSGIGRRDSGLLI